VVGHDTDLTNNYITQHL